MTLFKITRLRTLLTIGALSLCISGAAVGAASAQSTTPSLTPVSNAGHAGPHFAGLLATQLNQIDPSLNLSTETVRAAMQATRQQIQSSSSTSTTGPHGRFSPEFISDLATNLNVPLSELQTAMQQVRAELPHHGHHGSPTPTSTITS